MLNIVAPRRGMNDDGLNFIVGRCFRCTNLHLRFLYNEGINGEVRKHDSVLGAFYRVALKKREPISSQESDGFCRLVDDDSARGA